MSKSSSDMSKAISKTLNIIFHDESLNCNNLKLLLMLFVQEGWNIPSEVVESIAVLLQGLEARVELDRDMNQHFYRARGFFDKLAISLEKKEKPRRTPHH